MLSTFLLYVCLAAGKMRNDFPPLGPWKAELRTKNKRATPIYFNSFAHIPRMLLAWFAPLAFQVNSFCQLIFRRWRAQGAQAVNWTSRICFHGFAHIPSVHFAWCAPLGFQVSSFVNWYLGGGGHNLHSLWTVLRAYVFIASMVDYSTSKILVYRIRCFRS